MGSASARSPAQGALGAGDRLQRLGRRPYRHGTPGLFDLGHAQFDARGDSRQTPTNERRGTKPTSQGMSHLVLAADGATLAARGRSSQILLWDPLSGRLLAELPDQPMRTPDRPATSTTPWACLRTSIAWISCASRRQTTAGTWRAWGSVMGARSPPARSGPGRLVDRDRRREQPPGSGTAQQSRALHAEADGYTFRHHRGLAGRACRRTRADPVDSHR